MRSFSHNKNNSILLNTSAKQQKTLNNKRQLLTKISNFSYINFPEHHNLSTYS